MIKYARANPARWWRTRRVGVVHRSPAAMFISPLRRWATMSVLALLLGLIWAVWFLTNPKRISTLAQSLLSDVLGGQVEVGGGRLGFAGTLELTGVKLRPRGDLGRGGGVALFAADEVKIRFDWLSLLVGDLRATQITATRPTLNLVEDLPTQAWNYETFQRAHVARPVSTGGPMLSTLPVILLREARVQWGEQTATQYHVTGNAVVDGQLSPDPTAPRVYQFSIEQRLDETTPATAPAEDALPGMVASGPPVFPTRPVPPPPLGRIHGFWDIEGHRFTAVTEPLRLGPALLRALPRQARQWCVEHQLHGELRRLQLSFAEDQGLQLDVELADMALQQPLRELMPELSRDVRAQISGVSGEITYAVKAGQLELRQLRGRIQGLPFQIAAHLQTGPAAPFDFQLALPDAHFTEDYPELMTVFPQTRELIQRLRPRGTFDIKVHVFRPEATQAAAQTTRSGPGTTSAAATATVPAGGADDDVKVEGSVLCKQAKARFIHFAYPMHNVNGLVHFDDTNVYFDKVTAEADENPVMIDGFVALNSADKTIDLTVSSAGVMVDERLGACLPARFLPIWRQFNPVGLVSFSCQVLHGPKPTDEEHVTVKVRPLDAEAMYREFPYRMRHIKGEFVIADEEATIQGLQARIGADQSGELLLSGKVLYPKGNLDAVDPQLKLEARHASLDTSLLHALPEEHRIWSRQVALSGRVDFVGNVARPQAEVIVNGTLNLSQMSAGSRPEAASIISAAAGGPIEAGRWKMTDITAQAQLSPEHFILNQMTGKTGPDGQCVVHLNADLDRSQATQMAFALAGDWRDLHLDPRVPSLLPPALAGLWSQYRPAGAIDGTFRVSGILPASAWVKESGGGQPPVPTTAPTSATPLAQVITDYQVDIAPRGLTLTVVDWPDAVSDLSGQIRLTPAALTFTKLRAVSGPAQVEASGSYQPAARRLDVQARLTADALPVKWIAILPKDLATYMADLKPEGAMTVDLPRLTWRGAGPPLSPPPGTGATAPGNLLPRGTAPGWDFQGEVTVSRLATEGPLISAVKDLKIIGAGSWRSPNPEGPAPTQPATATAENSGGLDFDGKLTAQTFTVTGKPIVELKGTIIGQAQARTLTLMDMDGKVAEGTIHGQIVIHAEKAMSYQASFVLSDAELASLLLPADAPADERKRVGTGRVTANLALQEQFGDRATRTGRGELVVRDGTIYNVPLSMGLMQLVTLRIPVSGAFTNAHMSYYIRDNKVTFEKILLGSAGVNLAGLGTLSLKDRQLDLRLVTESPSAFKIPVVDVLRSQLLQLQVTGPVESPKIIPIPLDAVSNTLQMLLPKLKPGN